MESMFQNCVSEFDLNLFEQATSVNQAAPLTPCPLSRKLGVARIKDRLKGISQVVHKAKKTNEIFLEVQKELLDTKQELEDTRNLLFEKNEEHKVICDERSTYFDRMTEYSNEVQKLKEQLKKFGDLDYDAKLKDQIINGYSDQMKGLQTEMDNLMDSKRRKEKYAAAALRQAKTSKALVEKKLARLLKEYVVPTTKKPDKWLETLIKKYISDAQIEGEKSSTKLEKITEADENQDVTRIDDEELSTQPVLHRNTSLDLDFVGSVDTGRGSSLAFSDGEKSFHSPDYYMNDSPPCTVRNIICDKCTLPKIDVSTSPISSERCDVANKSATSICNRIVLAKKDACTSPIPSQILDIAINTSDDSVTIIAPSDYVTSNSEGNNLNVDPIHMDTGKISQMIPSKNDTASGCNEILSKHNRVSDKELYTSPRTLQDFTFDTDDDDDEIVSNGSRITSPVQELNTSSPVPINTVVTIREIIPRTEEATAEVKAVKPYDNIAFDSLHRDENVNRDQSHVRVSFITPSCGNETASSIKLEKQLSKSVQLQDDAASEIDNDEVMHNVSQNHVYSPINFDDNPTIMITPTTPTEELQHKTSDATNTQQEKECLESNNSNVCNNDVDIDSEIRTILDNMRPRYQILTPIPTTPPRRKMQSPILPVENRNVILSQQARLVAETINEQINLLRTKIQEVFTPFAEIIPQCLEQIPQLFSHSDLNEEILRNLLHDPNKSYEKHSYNENTHPSFNARAESNIRLQPDMVDLNTGSMLCITETSEHEDFVCNDYTIIEEDLEAEDQITSIETNDIQYEEICQPNKEVSHVGQNNKMSDAQIIKAEKSDFIASLNAELRTDNSFNSGNNTQVTHQNTRGVFYGVNTQDIVVNSNTVTTPSTIESRNSIVYESRDISDDDADMQIAELDNSTEDHKETPDKQRKRKGKMKKLTKLETLRLKMKPKCKIKSDNAKPAKKLCSKRIPINTVPKKSVIESDTAASLNDKSVYENAVKVITALRIAKQPKIIVEDCRLYPPNNINLKNNDDNISMSLSPTKINTPENNKRKISVNSTNVSESLNLNNTEKGISPKKIEQKATNVPSQELSSGRSDAEILSPKRTHRVVDTLETEEPKQSLNAKCDKSPQIIKQKANGISLQKPSLCRTDAEIRSPKRTRRAMHTLDSSETEEPERSVNAKYDKSPQRMKQKANDTSLQKSLLCRSDAEILSPKRTRRVVHALEFNETEEPDGSVNAKYDKSPQRMKQKANSISPLKPSLYKSNAEIMSPKRSRRVVRISDSSETEEPKRKRISVVDHQRPHRNSKQEDIIDSDSPRILRSSHVKHNKETKSEETPIVTRTRERLRLKEDQNRPESSENNSIISLGKKPRIARQKRISVCAQAEVHSSTVTETTIKANNRVVSYEDLSLFPDKDSPDQTVDKNKVEIDDNALIKKSKIARPITRRSSGNTLEEVNTESEISRKADTVVSYEDLSLFSNEDIPDQKADQEKPETDDSTSPNSSARLLRITRQNTCQNTETTADHHQHSILPEVSNNKNNSAVSYEDLNLFSTQNTEDQTNPVDTYRKDSLLCRMIEKYGVERIKYIAKRAPDAKVNEICKKLEISLSEIIEVPHEVCERFMKRLVTEIRSWNPKHFILGFIKYLKDPQRKIELYNKSICPPFPPMTKKEQVLLYVLDELQNSCNYRNIVKQVLMNIEYTLLALNKAAETFDVIETMSHFYALLCRNYQKISKLRLFIIDSMYCLQLKSVILVQQCLEVWMSVLPLGHMGLAKSPLVTCLVYLLHFFKSGEDKYNRVADIRNTLRYKYNYDMPDWNENKMLDVFKAAIIEIRDHPMEWKTLRLSLLILAKRHGAMWCHSHIVKSMLQPLITDSSTTAVTKRFCVSLLGPLLKPYPAAMKVHYEMVIDYLMDMLQRKNSPKMQEAIISSLICVDKNNDRLYKFLAKWSPKQVSPEFELAFKDYVRSKPVNIWKRTLSWQSF